MAVLKKELTLYERDDKGQLIGQTVKLAVSEQDAKDYPELVDSEVVIVPMTRGQLRKMFGVDGKSGEQQPETDRDQDGDIIAKHCVNPAYTKDDLAFVKPHVVRSIVKTIFRESGIKVDDEEGTRTVDEDADEFGKNS